MAALWTSEPMAKSKVFWRYSLAAGEYAVPFLAVVLSLDYYGLVNLAAVPFMKMFAFSYLFINGASIAPVVFVTKIHAIQGVPGCPNCHRQLKRVDKFRCENCGDVSFSKIDGPLAGKS